MRSAQLASKELAESRARRRRRREDYILLQVAGQPGCVPNSVDETDPLGQPPCSDSGYALSLLQLGVGIRQAGSHRGDIVADGLMLCRRGSAPKLWLQRAPGMLASLMQLPAVPRVPAHTSITTMEVLDWVSSRGTRIRQGCTAAAR